MRIAIPVFQNRVSPVFDWASRVLVIETDGHRELRREENSLGCTSLIGRADRLAEMRVDSLVCGGISEHMLALLIARGINVIPWIAGETDKVFSAFLDGQIPGKDFTMPGRCGQPQGEQQQPAPPVRRLRS